MWIKDFTSDQDNPYRDPPFVAITHLCYCDTLPDWEYPLHSHENEFEIVFIMEGRGTFTVDETDTEVTAGSICVIPPKKHHHFSGKSEGEDGKEHMEYYALRFDANPSDGPLQAFFYGLGTAVSALGNYFSYISDTFRLLLGLYTSNGGYSDEKVQSVCFSLLQVVQMLLENEALTIRTQNDCSMNDVLYYITEHCEEKITLQSLGEKFAISPSHLSRLFSSAFHTSPIEYLIRARIARATEYLGKTDKSVREIAELVGYDNPFYFTTLFTRRVGCSPTEYRERLDSRDLPHNSQDIFYHPTDPDPDDPPNRSRN